MLYCNLLKSSIKVQATFGNRRKVGRNCLDSEKSKNSDSNLQYPIIRFQTRKNKWITKAVDSGISTSTYKQGDKINVIYNPDKPEEFMIESKWQILISKGLLFAGVGSLFIGLFLFYQWYTA
jgi:hypothetical protein